MFVPRGESKLSTDFGIFDLIELLLKQKQRTSIWNSIQKM